MITVYLKSLKIHYISVLFEYNKVISLFQIASRTLKKSGGY